jgi:DNA-binding response OmpR family regulator
MRIAAHARRRNPQACVVMLTAYGSEATEQQARRCGVDVYQTKPVELPRLTVDIERVLTTSTRTAAVEMPAAGSPEAR